MIAGGDAGPPRSYDGQMGAGELETRVRAALEHAAGRAPDDPGAAPDADEAARLAVALDDPALLATALRLRLRAHPGPDDVLARFDASLLLKDVAGQLRDPDVELHAIRWRLTVALEQLDLATIRRELAALDVLAERTGVDEHRFYASARRAMFALTEGDVVGATVLATEAARAGAAASTRGADAELAVLHAQMSRQRNDQDALARAAQSFEAIGMATARTVWLAEAAVLWLDAGEPDRAGVLVDRLTPDLAGLARDADWLAVVCKTCEAAAGTGRRDTARTCAELLGPYTGHVVLEADGVTFAGVVEDYLVRATGDPAHAARARAAYERIGAYWWARRTHLLRSADPVPPPAAWHLHPVDAPTRLWCVGRTGATATVPPMPGLEHLRSLLRQPGHDLEATELYLRSGPEAPSGGVHPDRARVVVRRAVMSALARLDLHDSELATELRSTLRLGSTCRYEPDPFRPVEWLLETTEGSLVTSGH